MDPTRLVAIDLGTSALRIAIFDCNGRIIYNKVIALSGQNTPSWLEILQRASPKTILKDIPSEDVHLSVCSTSGSIILINENGKPLLDPIMYYEQAPTSIVSKIQALDETNDLSKKGVSISSTSPLCKLINLKENNPSLFNQIYKILTPTSWLLYLLKHSDNEIWDNLSIDWTNGLKFGIDITKNVPEWYYPLYEKLNISTNILPDLQPCGTKIGTANSSISEILGLKNVNLYHGMTDGTATALVTGSIQPRKMGISLGSSSTIKYSCNEIKLHPSIYYHKHPLKGFIAGAAPITGSFFNWIINNVLNISFDEAQTLAGKIKPGTEYLFFPQGDREPFNSNQMGAAFLGLWPNIHSINLVRGKLIRSIMLGISFAERVIIDIIENLFKSSNDFIGITGGGSSISIWNEIRAAVYEKILKIIDTPISFGSLIPVILNIGLYKNNRVLEKQCIQIKEYIYPEVRLIKQYKKRSNEYIKKWTLLQEIYNNNDRM